MFSGFLQTVSIESISFIPKLWLHRLKGAYNGLNGVHGLAGWKCLLMIKRICKDHSNFIEYRVIHHWWDNNCSNSPVRVFDHARFVISSILFNVSDRIDLPSNTRPNILYTEAQIDIAKKRMELIGRKPPAKFTKQKVIGFFSTWHIYFLTLRRSFLLVCHIMLK